MQEHETSSGITSDMTVLDLVHRYRFAEDIIKSYDEKAGECICCMALFEPLWRVAEKYRLNLGEIIDRLEEAARSES